MFELDPNDSQFDFYFLFSKAFDCSLRVTVTFFHSIGDKDYEAFAASREILCSLCQRQGDARFRKLARVMRFEGLRVDRFEYPELNRREFEGALDCAGQLWLIFSANTNASPERITALEDQLRRAIEILRIKNGQLEEGCGIKEFPQKAELYPEDAGESLPMKGEPESLQSHTPPTVAAEESPAPKQAGVRRRIEPRCEPDWRSE